jgi:hypothetical protein
MRTTRSLTPLRLVIGLALFAIPAILIHQLGKDMVADIKRETGYENIPANPHDIEDSQSLYRAENFRAAMSALEERAGTSPELLYVSVMPHMAEFQVKDGQRAKGYRYYAKNRESGEFKVKLLGRGSLEGSQFPYKTLSPGVTETLAAAVAQQGGGLRATNMTIRRGVTDGDLAWSVTTESDERTGVVFQADPDGSGFDDPIRRALERNGVQ